MRFSLADLNERFSPRLHVLFCDYFLICSDLSARNLSHFPSSFFIFHLYLALLFFVVVKMFFFPPIRRRVLISKQDDLTLAVSRAADQK